MKNIIFATLGIVACASFAISAEWGKSGTTLPRVAITFGNASSGTCTKSTTLVKGAGIFWCYSTNKSRQITIQPN